MKKLPLFGSGINSYATEVTRQRRLNVFYDVRQDGDKSKVVIRGTPGSTLWLTLPDFPVRGWRVVSGLLYVVAGTHLYSVSNAGVVTALGTLSTNAGYVSVADNNAQLIIVDGSFGYIYTIIAGSYHQSALNAQGSFGKITDSGFPNGAQTVVFLDGKFVVSNNAAGSNANPRRFQVSSAYDGTYWTWNSGLTVYGTKEGSADNLIAVFVTSGTLVMFGELTAEFWQDTGSSPLQFARISGAVQNWGLAALQSLAVIGDAVLFLGQTQQGELQVMMLQGYSPTKVSTPDVESVINTMSSPTDAVGLTYTYEGHSFYQITFQTGNRSFLFDITTGFWYESQTDVALLGRHYANFGIGYGGKSLFSDTTTGNVYYFDRDNYTDSGTAIKRQVATRHIQFEGNDGRVCTVFLDMETGVGLQAGQGFNPTLMMQVSKDGGKTFGPEKWVSMGIVGAYRKQRVLWRRLGLSTDFVLQFTVTDPVKFVVIDASADLASSNYVRQ